MKKNFATVSLLAIFTINTLSSCKKSKECEDAGLGGELTVVATLKHHSKIIYNQGNYNDTVFVKYNAQDLPGLEPSDYDTYFVGDSGEDHVHLEALKCGQYYLFGAGFDTTITMRVIGGIPFNTDQKEGEVEIVIPVTEGD